MVRESAAGADERAGKAQKSAEDERFARVKLQLEVGPRRLTIEQQKDISKACLGLYGKPIVVRSYPLDAEGAALASQIANALTLGGIRTVTDFGTTISSGGYDAGVLVLGPPEEEEMTRCLGHALHDKGNLEVTVNGCRHIAGMTMGGTAIMSGRASMGGGGVIPASPLTSGSPIEILVGVKPVQYEVLR